MTVSFRETQSFYEEAVVRMTEGMVQDFVKDLLNSIRERGIDTKAAIYGIYWRRGKAIEPFLEQSDRLGKYTFIVGYFCQCQRI